MKIKMKTTPTLKKEIPSTSSASDEKRSQGRISGMWRSIFITCAVLIATAAVRAETFTLVLDKALPNPGGLWLYSSVAYVPSLDRFYVYDGATFVRVLNHAGVLVSSFGASWGQYFCQSGMTTDPVTGKLLVLQDPNPGSFGPGARVLSIDPATFTQTFFVEPDPVTEGEPIGLAVNPANGNLIIAEVRGTVAGNDRIIEVTRTGTFLRTLLSGTQLGALGVGFYADGGIEIFPPTGELIFAGGSGILYALNLTTLTTREFFKPMVGSITGMAFGPAGELALITSARLYLYGNNSPPIANAEPDFRANESTPVTLDGTSSHDPNTPPLPLSYTWTQLSGPTVTLANANTATPSFSAPIVPARRCAGLQAYCLQRRRHAADRQRQRQY